MSTTDNGQSCNQSAFLWVGNSWSLNFLRDSSVKTDDFIKMINSLSKTDDFIKMLNSLSKTNDFIKNDKFV